MIDTNIVIRRNKLTGDFLSLPYDTLIEVKAPTGKRRFILIDKAVYGDILDIETAPPTEYSATFRQYYLRLGGVVVGSMLEVAKKWCMTSSYTVGYMPPQDEVYTFSCPVEGQSGGLLVYEDGHGSFFASPASTPNSNLVIRDEKEV